MKKILIALSMLVSMSSFANYARTVEVYKIVSVSTSEDSSGWTTLKTKKGLSVFVRCSQAQFDDATHDRVGGFKNSKECREFLAYLTQNASVDSPVGIQIGPDFTILIEKEM